MTRAKISTACKHRVIIGRFFSAALRPPSQAGKIAAAGNGDRGRGGVNWWQRLKKPRLGGGAGRGVAVTTDGPFRKMSQAAAWLLRVCTLTRHQRLSMGMRVIGVEDVECPMVVASVWGGDRSIRSVAGR
jgi:hypothetical protein